MLFCALHMIKQCVLPMIYVHTTQILKYRSLKNTLKRTSNVSSPSPNTPEYIRKPYKGIITAFPGNILLCI